MIIEYRIYRKYDVNGLCSRVPRVSRDYNRRMVTQSGVKKEEENPKETNERSVRRHGGKICWYRVGCV